MFINLLKGWRILVKFIPIRHPMLKLKTHSGFHDLFLKYNILKIMQWQCLCVFVGICSIQNILRNTTQVIIRHRVKILLSVISSLITLERQKWKSSKMKGILLSSLVSCCRMITWVVFLRMFWNFISSLPVKRGGSLSFLMIFTFAVPELLDLIWRKIGFLPYTTQVIIRHRVKILFSIISSPITRERQKWKSSKRKGILLSSPVSCWKNFNNRIYLSELCSQ
jgi:hypothetical protein